MRRLAMRVFREAELLFIGSLTLPSRTGSRSRTLLATSTHAASLPSFPPCVPSSGTGAISFGAPIETGTRPRVEGERETEILAATR